MSEHKLSEAARERIKENMHGRIYRSGAALDSSKFTPHFKWKKNEEYRDAKNNKGTCNVNRATRRNRMFGRT